MNLSDAELALVGTIVGSVGLELIRRLLDRKDKQQDHGAQIRQELRDEVLGLRDALAKAKESEVRLNDEVDEWKSKFYDKRDEDIKNQTDLMLAKAEIAALQEQVGLCKQRLIDLEKKILEKDGE